MDDLIKLLISKDSWLALWLASELYRNWQNKKQMDDYHRTLVVIAKNSTTAIMAFTDMLKSDKQRKWGEQVDTDFENARRAAARRLEEDAP